ncbi:hypothetical protein [Shewanella sp. SNU WT4]|uniref:hypothetical protein n=1 Tax=Shewanella sp. SNU WT4 TaxID=2590015 RepID=UPI00143DA494|nr:hypothetical protein [Shewanella sp. SNU WT4]
MLSTISNPKVHDKLIAIHLRLFTPFSPDWAYRFNLSNAEFAQSKLSKAQTQQGQGLNI